jgi:hypothetical protein
LDDKQAPDLFRILMLLARPEEKEAMLYGTNSSTAQRLVGCNKMWKLFPDHTWCPPTIIHDVMF